MRYADGQKPKVGDVIRKVGYDRTHEVIWISPRRFTTGWNMEIKILDRRPNEVEHRGLDRRDVKHYRRVS